VSAGCVSGVRYVTSDPIGLAGGLNTYGYVKNNPLLYIDLLGLSPLGSPGGNWGLGDPTAGGDSYVGDAVGGIGDFIDAYADMMDATYGFGGDHNGWAGQDAYFHCRANCEAAQRGQGGEDVAMCISDAREWADQAMGDPVSASEADQIANEFGRAQGSANPTGNCSQLCGRYRPGGSFPF